MSIVEVLENEPEQLPEWLAGNKPPQFDRKQFFASRTVYYPGCGDDGQPSPVTMRCTAKGTVRRARFSWSSRIMVLAEITTVSAEVDCWRTLPRNAEFCWSICWSGGTRHRGLAM